MGENLGQERIIESHTVGPEVQGIQNQVEALFPIERIGVAPGVSAGLAPQRHHRSSSCLTLSRPPVTSHLMFSNRALSITAPCLWNILPPELHTILYASPIGSSTRDYNIIT